MSSFAVQAAWRYGVDSPGEKVILLALAEQADWDGETVESVKRLAWLCKMGERTVRRHLEALRRSGAIIYLGPDEQGRSRYRMNMPGCAIPERPAPPEELWWYPRTPGGSADLPPDDPPCQSGRGAKLAGGEGVKGPSNQLQMPNPSPTTPPSGRAHAPAHAREAAATPDPKPASAQPVIAAWLDARKAAGFPDPPPVMVKTLGRTAKRLLRDGAQLDHVTRAAALLATTRYGPTTLASFTDQVARGQSPGQNGRMTIQEAIDHNPFAGNEGTT